MPLQVRTRADDVDKHTFDVNSMIYHKGKLYTGADDGQIKVWQEDLRLIASVQAHESSVYSITASDDKIYSCSNDGTIKSFTSDLKPLATLHKVPNEIWKLVYANGFLYAGDDQGMVICFENDQVKSLMSTSEPVKGMLVLENVLYTVRDLDVVIAEIKENKNTIMRKNIMGRAPICLAGNKLCISSRSGKEIIVHENSHELDYKKIKEFNASEMIVNALCGCPTSDGGALLYSGGWDKIVKQWKITNDDIKLVDECNADIVVNALTYGEKGEIYAGGSDGHIIRIDV